MSAPFQVLITDRFSLDALAFLRTKNELEIKTSRSPDPLAEEMASANALIIRSRTKITEDLLSQAPHLELIITATSGFDHIDLDATRSKEIPVLYTPDANAASAAELTWALVLACARKIPAAHQAIKAGNWNRNLLMGTELSQKTYGIIGLGRIGKRVARIAKAFNMKVIAFDPYINPIDFEKEGVECVGFEEVLKLSDVLSLHVPSTNETYKMINSSCLEFINRGIIFVNTSRGSVVDEEALAHALESGWISQCGLDVFEKEPLPRNSHLLQQPQVVFSPHLGATTNEAFAAASQEAANKVLEYVQTRHGMNHPHCVNSVQSMSFF